MAESFFDRIHKNNRHTPDVLSCLANLSNDEVFTPPDVVNEMLDMLPQDLFRDPNIKFLDPACKTGVFLREIAKRLLVGLEPVFPDLQERIDHIFHNQLYGIAITELTSLLSRRSLYCSKYPNGPYSITKFDDSEGNIRFKKTKHTWDGNQCKFCGASKAEYDRSPDKETHAYEFLHFIDIEEAEKMGFFDVIISNPPYQLSDGGNESSAKPIYNLFFEQAKKLNPSYISMIIPSRWMQGGKGLDKFREEMIADTRISYLKDFEDSQECFTGVHIDGGICYFLWDNSHNGSVDYVYKTKDNEIVESKRLLKNKYSNAVIRDNRQISIIDKVCRNNERRFSEIVSSRKPYGIAKDLFNSPERYPGANLSNKQTANSLLIHGVKGHKGGAKRVSQYIVKDLIRDDGSVNKHKLFFTTSYTAGAINPPEPIMGYPGVVCTETFLRIGPFDSETEMNNCYGYIHTNFFKALLKFRRGSMQVTKTVFEYIPLQDFSKQCTDEDLYKKYNLSDEEINYINNLCANK